MKSGILSQFRSKGINIYNTKYFKITAPNFVNTESGFCSISLMKGRAGYAVFDGDLNTSFASDDQNSEDNKNISIEFVKNPIFINGYSIKTVCGPPKEIIVDASNDGTHWLQIDHVTTALSRNSVTSYICDRPGSYRIIRFTQIGKNIDDKNYRIHINEIEIHGYVTRNTQKLIKKRICLHYLLFISICSIS